jgi:hypothetical protein
MACPPIELGEREFVSYNKASLTFLLELQSLPLLKSIDPELE